MRVERTGVVQTENTETGIITTAEEMCYPKGKKPFRRFVQVGYTSVQTNSEGKKYVDGLVGKELIYG